MTDLVPEADVLFERVAAILDEARGNVVRAVNTNMVVAYWLIGREIVMGVQEGQAKAEYGAQILRRLSERLQARFGSGFSLRNLSYFRSFYLAFQDREPISHLTGAKLVPQPNSPPISHLTGAELQTAQSRVGFAPELTWSHYQRILSNQGEAGLVAAGRERLPGERVAAEEILRSPVVLEFLSLPDHVSFHEGHLEQAIIDNLQAFLLELGKGFSFVARQKHLRFDDEDFYVDLVFYNFILKCFLLIDLKIGKLTHRDVGQMDGYVRLFEDQFKVPGDNPTIGLILCSEKNEAVAKYSVLSESRQLFASKYLPYLPSEEELVRELTKERLLIEARAEVGDE